MAFLLAAILFATTMGCSGGSSRAPIEGVVTFEGKPVPNGQINFVPMPGTDGPTAGSIITDGRYAVPAEKGLRAGQYRVEINAMRATSQKTQTMNAVTGEMETGESYEPYIPARYNAESELTAEVKPGEANQFNFSLKP